jgi:hypothetical protein
MDSDSDEEKCYASDGIGDKQEPRPPSRQSSVSLPASPDSYTCDMNVYLGKDRQTAAKHMTATHATVTNLTRGVEGYGHKLYMYFFSSPDLYDDLAQKFLLLLWDS